VNEGWLLAARGRRGWRRGKYEMVWSESDASVVDALLSSVPPSYAGIHGWVAPSQAVDTPLCTETNRPEGIVAAVAV
jgi:hypothetical protein